MILKYIRYLMNLAVYLPYALLLGYKSRTYNTPLDIISIVFAGMDCADILLCVADDDDLRKVSLDNLDDTKRASFICQIELWFNISEIPPEIHNKWNNLGDIEKFIINN